MTSLRKPPGLALLLLPVAGTLFATACQQTTAITTAPSPTIAAPAPTADKAADLAGLHNVVTYAPGLVCGAVPEGAAGLATLASMGIKTIVSVDGATPDVANAEALGMRYIHLPISYNGVEPDRQKELAQVISSCEGPVYMHCHHGKHRSAAALGSAAVLAGKLTPDQAMDRMKVSGTAENYKGLWQDVREAKPIDGAQLKADPASFPKVAKVSGMVATMSEIDTVFDNVKAAQKAGWTVPKDHPDLVPEKESKRLHSLFVQLQSEPESKEHPADYQAMLGKSIAASEALDAAVRGKDKAAADRHFDVLGKGCKECHKGYRDN